MNHKIGVLMLFEAATFILAAFIHSGAIIAGSNHHEARNAESVIAIVLLLGVLTIWIRPAWTRRAALATQGFALLATFVGLFTIAIGVGPGTVPDLAYHFLIVAVLIYGLLWSKRMTVIG